MLTSRQIDILSYLLNERVWVTSEKLSEYFKINKKTIQHEIKDIQEVLGKSCVIEINNRMGYCVKHISEEMKYQIVNDIEVQQIHNSLESRPASIALYLLFQKKYISMQRIADTFFISKTAVAREMETVRRWMERNKGISMEVSNAKGIMVHSKEERKRIFCSVYANISIVKESKLGDNFEIIYAEYMEIIKKILQEVLVKYNYIITGEEFSKICRLINFSVLRSKMEYTIEKREKNHTIHPMINKIAEYVEVELEYRLKYEEMIDIQNAIYESSVLYANHEHIEDLQDKFILLEKRIAQLLGLDYDSIFKSKEIVIQHISHMFRRAGAGNVAVNYSNEKIICNYPLEHYLISYFFLEVFDLPVSKELSFVTLFLASALEKYKNKLSVLLVSNNNISIADNIKILISKRRKIDLFEVQPIYLYEAEKKQKSEFDILLTTEQEMLYKDSEFILLEAILESSDLKKIDTLIERKEMKIYERKRNEIISKYYNEKVINENIGDLESILKSIEDVSDPYFLYQTIGSELLYVCGIIEEGKTQIILHSLKNSIIYKNKKIKKVIFITFCKGDENIFEFFSTISYILKDNL